MQPAKDVDRVTDEQTYLNRRNFLRAGILTASVVATGWAYRKLNSTGAWRRQAPPSGQGGST